MDDKELALVKELVRRLRALDDEHDLNVRDELERILDWFTLRFPGPLL